MESQMHDAIAVINAGSSSIKFAAFDEHDATPRRLLAGSIRDLANAPRFLIKNGAGDVLQTNAWEEGTTLNHGDATAFMMDRLQSHLQGRRLRAIGHRVVHGGEHYVSPVRVDAQVFAALESLVPLAPLHQPHNLALIRTLLATEPDLPQIACFDTSFHQTQLPVERAFALPHAITERGVRRYGFHGLSYEYIASAMRLLDPALAGRVVVLHLGNGASMCAMQGGKSVANTMGFTALDGLPMGTRCGSLDPGVVLYLMQEFGMAPDELERVLYQQSGLLGVSGISSDMRTLEDNDSPQARDAIDLFVHAIKRQLGALAATLGGLDGIVFTAGIGENSVAVRQRVCQDAAWLGVELDQAANRAGASLISTATSAVSAWIIPTDEEAVIAEHTRRLLRA